MSVVLDISDVNGLCRLCLKENGTIIPIFGRENTSKDCIPLSKKILDCVSIKVCDGDGLSHMICVGCVHQVDSWHGFKNACDSSQEKLMSWLQKTSPDIFAKNEAANRRRNKARQEELFTRSSTVIDLSSDDDDDVVITHQHSGRRSRRSRTRPSSHSQNIEVISLSTNEVEIFPVDDDFRNKEKEINRLGDENIPSGETELFCLPSVLSDADGTDSGNPAEDHILPDSGGTEAFDNSALNSSKDIHPKVEAITKDLLPKETKTCNGVLSPLPPCESSHEDAERMDTGEDIASESQCMRSLSENTSVPEPATESLDPAELGGSTWSQSNSVTEALGISGIEPLSKTNDETNVENGNNLPGDDNSNTGDQTLGNTLASPGKPQEDSIESHSENSSPLVIEKVTSLNNHETERMDEDSSSRPADHESVDGSRSWSRLGPDDDSQDVQSDIVMCESTMVVNVKEEPLSAGEITGDEEDPLNFHSVTIKKEPEDWTGRPSFLNEPEDVKPNVQLLNEAMENQYTPKKLKSGKIHCEPCRVSFLNDVYYERHTQSLRHKMNVKLYRAGKGPTRKRGKSLVQAIMGTNYTTKGNGPFCCTQCPSRFKHSRNLTSHLKKHFVSQTLGTQEEDEYMEQDSADQEDCLSQDGSTSSKPPTRASAQNVKFVNDDIPKCELCDQNFSTFPALFSHRRFCGLQEKRVCRWCQQNFTTTSLYFKHRKECVKLYRKQILDMNQQKRVNNIPAPVPSPVPLDGTVLACTLCNLTFQTSTDLITHMQHNHMDFGKPETSIELPNFAKPNSFTRTHNSRLNYCKYCFKSFPSHSALSSHTGYHARKSIYCCKFCKQSYRDKLTFRQHMKIHISDPNLNKSVCWICYTPFSSQKDLIDHKTVHINIRMKIFSCDVCGNSYNTRELLTRHKKTAHNLGQAMVEFGQNVLQTYSNDSLRDESKIQLMDEDNKLFKCRICKKRFTTIGNLKRHGIIHKRLPNLSNPVGSNEPNRCNWCFRTFKTQSGLWNHKPGCNRVKVTGAPKVNAVPGGGLTAPIRCKGCKKWFASRASLYKHKVMKRCLAAQQQTAEREDSHLNPQNCPNCDQQFLSEESLGRHKQHCKPTIEKLTCDCGEVFSNIDLKQSHADSCPANCTCKKCNMKFNSPDELDSHNMICQLQVQPISQPEPPMKIVLENRFPPLVCSKCNKKFVYTKSFKIHQDKCLYDRWPCTNCLEIFPTESSLSTHKSHKSCFSPRLNKSLSDTSANESPTFKCEYCPQRFLSGNELQQHSLICDNRSVKKQRNAHTEYSPGLFTCELCGKAFSWKANLQRHHKNAHSNVSEPQAYKVASPAQGVSPEETGIYRCKLCPDIAFHKQQGFFEHQLAHERQGGNFVGDSDADDGSGTLLTCELCDKKLPESLYPMHMDEHMNDDFEETHGPPQDETLPQKFPCDVCGKEFYTKVSMNSHRAIHFRAGEALSHLSPKKTSPQPKKSKFRPKHVRCTICNKLLSINSLPKHKMMHRREAAEFYGDNQRMKVSNNTPIVNTARSSTPAVSESSFTQEGSEESPMTTFPCPKCDKSFKLRKSLMEHLKGHLEDSSETESISSNTGPADQYPYKCLYCDLSWKYKSVYDRHMSSKKHLEIQKQLTGII